MRAWAFLLIGPAGCDFSSELRSAKMTRTPSNDPYFGCRNSVVSDQAGDVEPPSEEALASREVADALALRLRKQQLLDECRVPPEVFDGAAERLVAFAEPFLDCLVRREQRDHARTYLAGMISDLEAQERRVDRLPS